jgi:hypothetical protein
MFISRDFFADRLCSLVVWAPYHIFSGLGFGSRHYQIFWEVVGLEIDPLSLMKTNEELLGMNISGSGIENQD